jgi:hypothetical protein
MDFYPAIDTQEINTKRVVALLSRLAKTWTSTEFPQKTNPDLTSKVRKKQYSYCPSGAKL